MITNNYPRAIELYTKSIELEPNILAYGKRGAARKQSEREDSTIENLFDLDFKSNCLDAAIHDYSHVLTRDSNDINGLR